MKPALRFPDAIDNSMRKELVKCQKIAHWKFERGLSGEESEDLIAGGAFAKGVEVMRRAYYTGGKGPQDALSEGIEALYLEYGDFKCPPPKKYKTSKTAERMAGALAYYAVKNPMEGAELEPFMLGGDLSVEIGFNHEIPVIHPTTGKLLTYCGRFDALMIDKDHKVWIVDEKTTGSMGDAWVNQWFLDSALTGYCWGARKLMDANGMADVEIAGAIINGIAIRALSNADPYEHMKCPVFRQPWFIDRWYYQMEKDVVSWAKAFVMQDHNMVLDHACALYNNPCAYATLCNAANPEPDVASYPVRFWNPLTRESEK